MSVLPQKVYDLLAGRTHPTVRVTVNVTTEPADELARHIYRKLSAAGRRRD